jgi:hypothetical protein
MRFSKFLTEKEEANNLSANVLIIMHRIFAAVEQTHIEKSDGMCEFNIGQAIKDKDLKSLNIAIKKGPAPSAKFAVKSDGDDYYIVIETPKYEENLEREDIIAILESASLKTPLHDAITHFLKYARDEFDEKNVPSHHEQKTDANQNVEQKYDALIKTVKSRLEDHHSAAAEIDRQSKQTSNAFKQDSFKMALEKLKEETHGKDFKGFLSIVNKLPEGGFIKELEGDLKKKILSRLEDYYEHYLNKQ